MTKPWKYLGYIFTERTIRPQKVILDYRELKTLNYFQKSLGDINWICPALGIAMANLQNLFNTLKASAEGIKELHLVENALNTRYLNKISPQHSLQFFLFPTRHSPTGLTGQLTPELRVTEWSFHSHSLSKPLSPHPAVICSLILDGKQRCAKLTSQA